MGESIDAGSCYLGTGGFLKDEQESSHVDVPDVFKKVLDEVGVAHRDKGAVGL